jgi:hypothetical protein
MTEKQKPPSERLIRWQLRLVRKVARAYVRFRFLEPVVSQNPDDTPGKRSIRWTPESAHYVIDVRNALIDAVEDQPDRKELIAAWIQILIDDSTIRAQESRLIGLLAPILSERKLDPMIALRKIRHGRPGRRAA